MNNCLLDASSNQAAFKSGGGGPSYFPLPPPLDLTSTTRRQISVVDSNEDGSNSTTSSAAESLEEERKLDSYSSNCKFESTTSDEERTTRSPIQSSEERWMDLKNEFQSTFARNSMPSPDPIFNSAHSLSRLMNYVHNVSPMALLQQQYAFRQNLVPPHLLPPPNPLLPTSILGNLAPTNQRFLSPPQLKTDQSKSEKGERALISRETDRNEVLLKAQIKDEGYLERRRKNNEAAKRSRDLRRMKEEEMAKRAKLLENENSVLRAENNALKYEVTRLHSLLSRTFNNPER